MAKTRTHIVPHRRRREGKTDYRKRLSLLKSGELRFVVRRSNQSVVCQIVQYDSKGDRTLVQAQASELKGLGWTCPAGNIPAAYLTGMLCAKRASESNIKGAILDTGIYRSTKGSRIFAALKGAVDGGLQIPHSDEVLPPDERITGKHIPVPAGERIAKELEEVRKKIMK